MFFWSAHESEALSLRETKGDNMHLNLGGSKDKIRLVVSLKS